VGFEAVLVEPSPKFQDRLVTAPEEVLEKLTSSGFLPLVGLAVKLATGATA